MILITNRENEPHMEDLIERCSVKIGGGEYVKPIKGQWEVNVRWDDTMPPTIDGSDMCEAVTDKFVEHGEFNGEGPRMTDYADWEVFFGFVEPVQELNFRISEQHTYATFDGFKHKIGTIR
jgi:hypothetical protein